MFEVMKAKGRLSCVSGVMVLFWRIEIHIGKHICNGDPQGNLQVLSLQRGMDDITGWYFLCQPISLTRIYYVNVLF